MNGLAYPALYAIVLWWFTTGLILFLDALPARTFRRSMIGATLALLAAVVGVRSSAADASATGAYLAFSYAIIVWGWLEMSFLLGFITGTRTIGCSPDCRGWQRFLHATQAIIYNELATAAAAVGLLAATFNGANRLALWTFLVLWSMRLSAKLNLFLGVPNLGEKFLPPHLQYLKTFFRRRRLNVLFPLSISAGTAATVWLAFKFAAAATPFDVVSYALLVTLTAVGVLEHWFMVIPLPSEKLWLWIFPAKQRGTAAKEEVLRQLAG